MLWNFLGFLSSIIGLVCFALSSSFNQLFGEWNLLKLLLYITLCFITCSIVLFAKKIKVSKGFMVKSHVGFLVLMLTSLYSYFYDRSVNGKPDAMSIISYAAFAFTSLCFSRKMELGFEVGLFNFFLGCLTVQLMKISLILAFVAVVFCYFLIVFRCYSDSQVEIGSGGTGDEEDSVDVVIDAANGVQPESASQNQGINEELSSSSGDKSEEKTLLHPLSADQNVWVKHGLNHRQVGGTHKDYKKWDDPNNAISLKHLSRAELVAYYNSEMTAMKRNYETRVQEMTEENFALKREFLRQRDSSLPSRK